MQIHKQIFLITVLTFFQLKSLAMIQAKVVALSKSGRSVKLDVGKVEGLKTGDIADLSIKRGTLEAPKYIYLGSVELLKLGDRDSSWFFKQVSGDKINRANFVAGSLIHLQVRSHTLRGRTRKKAVYQVKSYESDKVKRNNRYAIDDVVPADLVQEKDIPNNRLYQVEKANKGKYEVVEKTNLRDGDEVIVSDGRLKYKYINSKLTPVDVSKLSQQEQNKETGIQNLAQLNKISETEDGYRQMYYHGRANLTGSDSKISILNTIDKSLEKHRSKGVISSDVKATLNKEGPLWSADMDTKQLSRYLKSSGIAREKFRREHVLAINSGNEIQLSFSSNLLANYTDADSNHQNLGYGLAISYEFHLIRAHQGLGKWSVDFGVDASNINVDIGGVNGRMTFTNIGTHLNYYFYNTPYARNKLLAYVGAGVKRGVGSMTSAYISAESYDYESVSVPSLVLGAKTRLSSFRDYEEGNIFGWGIGAKINYESLSLNPISEISANDNSRFELNQNINNIKFIASLSVFF